MRRSHTLIAVACSGLLAAAAQAQPVCYRLADTSMYTEGCLPPCLCPILIDQSLRGTFVLEETSNQGTFIEYDVHDVRLRIDGPIALSRTFVGRGQYTRISGIAGWMHEMRLMLSVDGDPPVAFESGLVFGGGGFPAIDIAVAQNGFFCYDIVLDLRARPGACRCLCEITDDGYVNMLDLLVYLDQWFADDPRADVDDHAGVDVMDLLTFLDCWFEAASGGSCP